MSEINSFIPSFQEHSVMYRGISDAYIGDKEPGDTGYDVNTNKKGYLYAVYSGESVNNLGPVTSYAAAVNAGYSGTEQEWTTELSNSSTNAQAAAASALSAGESKDAAEDAQDAAEAAQIAAENAQDLAASWATGSTDGTPGSTNNAKYYSDQASASATTASEAIDTVSETLSSIEALADDVEVNAGLASDSADAAATSEEYSELWATGETGGTPNQNNNAKAWAAYSRKYADGKDLDGNTIEDFEENNAKYYCDTAKLVRTDCMEWANGLTSGSEPSATNNSKYYSEQSSASALQSSGYVLDAEAWATGKRNNVDVQDTDPTYHNNAKYYSDSLIYMLNHPVTQYQNSTSGTVVPSGTWQSSITPEKGKYTWSKTTYNWGSDVQTYSFYNVSYVGADSETITTITTAEIDALFA